jgi:hypothetical protein
LLLPLLPNRGCWTWQQAASAPPCTARSRSRGAGRRRLLRRPTAKQEVPLPGWDSAAAPSSRPIPGLAPGSPTAAAGPPPRSRRLHLLGLARAGAGCCGSSAARHCRCCCCCCCCCGWHACAPRPRPPPLLQLLCKGMTCSGASQRVPRPQRPPPAAPPRRAGATAVPALKAAQLRATAARGARRRHRGQSCGWRSKRGSCG